MRAGGDARGRKAGEAVRRTSVASAGLGPGWQKQGQARGLLVISDHLGCPQSSPLRLLPGDEQVSRSPLKETGGSEQAPGPARPGRRGLRGVGGFGAGRDPGGCQPGRCPDPPSLPDRLAGPLERESLGWRRKREARGAVTCRPRGTFPRGGDMLASVDQCCPGVWG